MVDDDFDSFQSMLDSVCGLISRGKYTPDAEGAALAFNALRPYPLADVSAAFSAHVRDPQRGKFAPTPADLIAQIEAARSDGRPGADEAWAMTPITEAQTVVWTNEIAEAFGIASTLLQSGDRVGARFAFKEAYERIVDQAKRSGRRPVWQVSLGHDLQQRKQALLVAVDKGLLTAEQAHDACPALPVPDSRRLLLPDPQPGRRQTFRQRLNEAVENMRAGATDPLEWARQLEQREKAGEKLHQSQRDAWRRALWGTELPEHVLFSSRGPIPDHLLPPAMRKHQVPANMTFDEQDAAAANAEAQALAWESQP
ncbi:MAG TPA: hypothetical protein VN201_13410 [Roseateles sp.]|nr:hypothetical protein [Roseateles sp.]